MHVAWYFNKNQLHFTATTMPFNLTLTVWTEFERFAFTMKGQGQSGVGVYRFQLQLFLGAALTKTSKRRSFHCLKASVRNTFECFAQKSNFLNNIWRPFYYVVLCRLFVENGREKSGKSHILSPIISDIGLL